MKRSICMGLPLAFVLGCHHNIMPETHPAVASCKSCSTAAVHGHGAQAAGPMTRRFANTKTQVVFTAPLGMKIGWESSMGGGGPRSFMPAQLEVPGRSRFNFDQGAIYRLKITDIAGHPGVPFYPSLEIAPSNPRIDAYLTHNAVPIEFTDEDFDQVSAGNFVTKVIYLPDPQHQELAIAGVETLVSTRLDPGVDPIAEADRRGTILAIVRLGGIDLEMPQATATPQSGMMPMQMIQMADGSVQMVVPDQVVMQDQSGQAIIHR